MTDKRNEFEKYVPIEIEDLDRFTINELSNKVLIEIDESEVEETVGGIITTGIKKFSFAKNALRRGTVVKTCKEIIPTRNESEFTLWQTDVQIKRGDVVYLNHFDMLNSYYISFEGRLMKIIPYASIICAMRNQRVIMCNGYALLEDYTETFTYGDVEIKKKLDDQGIIRYIGKPNKMYYLPILKRDHEKYIGKGMASREIYGSCDGHYLVRNKKKSDPAYRSIKVGDRVIIGSSERVFYLEEWAYARFNQRKLYRVCQQHNLIAVLN